MNSINKSDLALQLLSIILLALTLHSCVANLDKQAEADHHGLHADAWAVVSRTSKTRIP